MAITLERARQLRAMIEAAAGNLTDADASTAAELFPRLKQDGSLVSAGRRIRWGGEVMRAAVRLWGRTDNNPDSSPTLWEDLAYREGIRIIPGTITAGVAFAKDELGWWGHTLYKSLLDANVWTPEQHASGWEKVTA